MHTTRPILTSRHFGWLTLAFTAFVIYGSLVPLAFRPLPLDVAWQRLIVSFSRPVAVDQRADWLANVLLFIPLGYLAMGWRCVDRPGRTWRPVLWILPCSSLLSATLEFTQLWFPPRDTSLNDVVAESIGAIIGIGAWMSAGQRLTAFLRRFWDRHAPRNWSIRLIPFYLLLLVFVNGMPFDLTLSLHSLESKYYHPNRLIRPLPFTRAGEEPLDLVKKALMNAAWFLPAGMLLAGLPGQFLRRPGAAWRVLGIGVALAASIEIMQLFVISRFSDSTDIVSGGLAVLAGWRIMRAWEERGAQPGRFSASLRGTLCLAWALALVFCHWEPFDFSADREFLNNRWGQARLLSTRDDLSAPASGLGAKSSASVGPALTVANDMLQKMLLFLPLGLFVSSGGAGYDRAVAFGAGFALSLLLETGEFFLRRHAHPGLSDLIVEPFGAWLGCLAVQRFQVFKQNALNEPPRADSRQPREGQP